ncbi:Uncharacterised protein [BD1-7 clade bacterium]|uniref:EVE domain-containing protein n=1 Tax=BD1-7 clade bacterium TaxID=2029982 RepID=A0A5S9NIV1_9GAMM|nr:Uncharacterised protein [BD1-7 clade bacterium]CAA0093179.1 Uncharacterised protein [BD1-7 clade bacterium]
MAYWLFKTEPDVFSIDDLEAKRAPEVWEGIRNYQARNLLRDEVGVGDRVFIYHSSCKHIGIAGIAEVTRTGFADPFQFNAASDYYDPKSDPDNPRWFAVDVRFVERFDALIPLNVLKGVSALSGMVLLNRSRLSIQPVSEQEWSIINNKLVVR